MRPFSASSFRPPAWALPNSSLHYNFTTGQYWPFYGITITRGSVGYAQDTGGTWILFGAGVPRITGKGLLCEEARTNSALWSRDMTNAAWTKVNMTTALTATGIDGTANSATTLTASGALATVLQLITLSSSADTYGVWLKRISGSGTIAISGDGITYTTVVPPSTWTLFSVTSTLVNPNFGIRVSTSGDSIAADFSQLEVGSFPTSPILTTTVAVTRNADVVTVSNPPGTLAVSLFARAIPEAGTTSGINQILLQADNGSETDKIVLRRTTAGLSQGLISISNASTQLSGAAWTQSVDGKIAISTVAGAQAMVFNAAAAITAAVTPLVVPSALRVGTSSAGTSNFNGLIEEIAVFPYGLSTGQLQAMTT